MLTRELQEIIADEKWGITPYFERANFDRDLGGFFLRAHSADGIFYTLYQYSLEKFRPDIDCLREIFQYAKDGEIDALATLAIYLLNKNAHLTSSNEKAKLELEVAAKCMAIVLRKRHNTRYNRVLTEYLQYYFQNNYFEADLLSNSVCQRDKNNSINAILSLPSDSAIQLEGIDYKTATLSVLDIILLNDKLAENKNNLANYTATSSGIKLEDLANCSYESDQAADEQIELFRQEELFRQIDGDHSLYLFLLNAAANNNAQAQYKLACYYEYISSFDTSSSKLFKKIAYNLTLAAARNKYKPAIKSLFVIFSNPSREYLVSEDVKNEFASYQNDSDAGIAEKEATHEKLLYLESLIFCNRSTFTKSVWESQFKDWYCQNKDKASAEKLSATIQLVENELLEKFRYYYQQLQAIDNETENINPDEDFQKSDELIQKNLSFSVQKLFDLRYILLKLNKNLVTHRKQALKKESPSNAIYHYECFILIAKCYFQIKEFLQKNATILKKNISVFDVLHKSNSYLKLKKQVELVERLIKSNDKGNTDSLLSLSELKNILFALNNTQQIIDDIQAAKVVDKNDKNMEAFRALYNNSSTYTHITQQSSSNLDFYRDELTFQEYMQYGGILTKDLMAPIDALSKKLNITSEVLIYILATKNEARLFQRYTSTKQKISNELQNLNTAWDKLCEARKSEVKKQCSEITKKESVNSADTEKLNSDNLHRLWKAAVTNHSQACEVFQKAMQQHIKLFPIAIEIIKKEAVENGYMENASEEQYSKKSALELTQSTRQLTTLTANIQTRLDKAAQAQSDHVKMQLKLLGVMITQEYQTLEKYKNGQQNQDNLRYEKILTSGIEDLKTTFGLKIEKQDDGYLISTTTIKFELSSLNDAINQFSSKLTGSFGAKNEEISAKDELSKHLDQQIEKLNGYRSNLKKLESLTQFIMSDKDKTKFLSVLHTQSKNIDTLISDAMKPRDKSSQEDLKEFLGKTTAAIQEYENFYADLITSKTTVRLKSKIDEICSKMQILKEKIRLIDPSDIQNVPSKHSSVDPIDLINELANAEKLYSTLIQLLPKCVEKKFTTEREKLKVEQDKLKAIAVPVWRPSEEQYKKIERVLTWDLSLTPFWGSTTPFQDLLSSQKTSLADFEQYLDSVKIAFTKAKTSYADLLKTQKAKATADAIKNQVSETLGNLRFNVQDYRKMMQEGLEIPQDLQSKIDDLDKLIKKLQPYVGEMCNGMSLDVAGKIDPYTELNEILSTIPLVKSLIIDINTELNKLLIVKNNKEKVENSLKLLPSAVKDLEKQYDEYKKAHISHTDILEHLEKQDALEDDGNDDSLNATRSNQCSYLLKKAGEIIATGRTGSDISKLIDDIKKEKEDLKKRTSRIHDHIQYYTNGYAKSRKLAIENTRQYIAKLASFGTDASELADKLTANLDAAIQMSQDNVFEITKKTEAIEEIGQRAEEEVKRLEDERSQQQEKRDALYQAHLVSCGELNEKLLAYELRFPQLVKKIRGKAGAIFTYLFTYSSSVKNTMDIDIDELQQLDDNVKKLIANLIDEITAKATQDSQKIADEISVLESQINRFESYFAKIQVSSNKQIQLFYENLNIKLSELKAKYGLEITVDASGNRKITSHEKFEYDIFHADVGKFKVDVDLAVSQASSSQLMLVAQNQKLQDERDKLDEKLRTFETLEQHYKFLANQNGYAKHTKRLLEGLNSYKEEISLLIEDSEWPYDDMKKVDQYCLRSKAAKAEIDNRHEKSKQTKQFLAICKKLKQDIDKEFAAVGILKTQINLVNKKPELQKLPENYKQGEDDIEKLVNLLKRLNQMRDTLSVTLESSVTTFFNDKANEAEVLRRNARALNGTVHSNLIYDYEEIEKADRFCKAAIKEQLPIWNLREPRDIDGLMKNSETSLQDFQTYFDQADANYQKAFVLYRSEFIYNKGKIGKYVYQIAGNLIYLIPNYQKIAKQVNQANISPTLLSKIELYSDKIRKLELYYGNIFSFLVIDKIDELALEPSKLRTLIDDVKTLNKELPSLTLELKKAILAEKFAERCNDARKDLQERLPGDTKYTALVNLLQQNFVIDTEKLHDEHWEKINLDAFEKELQEKVYKVLALDIQQADKEEKTLLATQKSYLDERKVTHQELVSIYQTVYKRISDLGIYDERNLKEFSEEVSEFSNITTVLSYDEFDTQKTSINQEIMALEGAIQNIRFALGMYISGVSENEVRNFNDYISNFTDLLENVSADKVPQSQELHRTLGLSITQPITKQHIYTYLAEYDGNLKDRVTTIRQSFEAAKQEVTKLNEKVEHKKRELNAALDQTQVRIQENITKKEGVATNAHDAEIKTIRAQLIDNCDFTSDEPIADIETQFSQQLQEKFVKPIDDRISSARSEVEQQIQTLENHPQRKQTDIQEKIKNVQDLLVRATNLHQLTHVKSEAERVTIVIHAEAIQDQYQTIQQKSEVLFSDEFTRHCTAEERSLMEKEIEAIKQEFATVEQIRDIETRAGNTKDLIERFEGLQQSMREKLQTAETRRSNLHSSLQERKTVLSQKIKDLSSQIETAKQLGVDAGTAPALLEAYQDLEKELEKPKIKDDEKAMSGLLESIVQQDTKFKGELSNVQTNIVQTLRQKFEGGIVAVNQGLESKVVDAKTNDKVKKVFEVLQIPASDTISVETVIDVLLETSPKKIKQVVKQLDQAVKTANVEITRVNKEKLDNARKEEEQKVKEALAAKISDAKSKVQHKIDSMRTNPQAKEEAYQTKITELEAQLDKAESLQDIAGIFTATVREEYLKTRNMSEALFNGEFSKHCPSECESIEKEFSEIQKESQDIVQAKTIGERIARTEQLIKKHEGLQSSMRRSLDDAETRRSNLHGSLQERNTNLSQKIQDLSNEIERAKQLGVDAGTAPTLLETYKHLKSKLDKEEIKNNEQAMSGLLTSIDVEEAKFKSEFSSVQTNIVQTLRQKFEKDIAIVSQGLEGKALDQKAQANVDKIFEALQIPVSETISFKTIIKVFENASPTQIKKLVEQVEETVKTASADITRVVEENAAQKREDEAVKIFATAEEITTQHADIQTRLKALGISGTTVSDPKDASQSLTIAPAPKQKRGSEIEYNQWKDNIAQAQNQYRDAIEQDQITLRKQLSITLDKLDPLNETIRNHNDILTKPEKVPQLRKVFEMLKQDTTSLQSELDKETVIDAVMEIKSVDEFESLILTIDGEVKAAVEEVSQRHQADGEAKKALAEQLVQPREEYERNIRDLLEYEEEYEIKTDVSSTYLGALTILEKNIRASEACETQEEREELIKSFKAKLDEYVQEAKEEISKTISAEQQTLTEIEDLLTNLKDEKELKTFSEFKETFEHHQRMAFVKKDIVTIHKAHANLVQRKLSLDFTETKKTCHAKLQELSDELEKLKKSGTPDRVKFWESEIVAHKTALADDKKVKLTPDVLQAVSARETTISKNIASIQDELGILQAKKEEAEAEAKRLAEEARLAQEAEENARKQAAAEVKRKKQEEKEVKAKRQAIQKSVVYEPYDTYIRPIREATEAKNSIWPEEVKKKLRGLQQDAPVESQNNKAPDVALAECTNARDIKEHVGKVIDSVRAELDALKLSSPKAIAAKFWLGFKSTFMQLNEKDLKLQRRIAINGNVNKCLQEIVKLEKALPGAYQAAVDAEKWFITGKHAMGQPSHNVDVLRPSTKTKKTVTDNKPKKTNTSAQTTAVVQQAITLTLQNDPSGQQTPPSTQGSGQGSKTPDITFITTDLREEFEKYRKKTNQLHFNLSFETRNTKLYRKNIFTDMRTQVSRLDLLKEKWAGQSDVVENARSRAEKASVQAEIDKLKLEYKNIKQEIRRIKNG